MKILLVIGLMAFSMIIQAMRHYKDYKLNQKKEQHGN